MKRNLMLLLAGACAFMPATACADDPPAPVPTVRVLQEMISAVADSLFAAPAPQSTASVRSTVQPAAHAWYLEHAVLSSARAHGLVPSEATGAQYDAHFGIELIGVTYENARRTWVLGEQVTDRMVHIAGTVKLVEEATGSILVARPFAISRRDTVPVVGIESLESPGIPATHGVAPASGMFSSLVEPIVLIGSVAVAVYLLFSVRN